MSIKRILLTGGRAPVTLDLIRKFSNFGHIVYVADSIEFYLSKPSKGVEKTYVITKPVLNFKQFLQDLLKIVRENKIDIIIPTCEEIFWIAKGKAILEKDCKVFCEPLHVLKSLHNKGDFIALVQQKGLTAPKTVIITSNKQLKDECDQYDYFVIKPVYSRFASNVLFSFNEQHKKEIMNLYPSKTKPYVLQQYVNGDQYCSYAVVIDGEIKAMSIYKSDMTAGVGATIAFQHTKQIGIESWMKSFFQQSHLTGQFAFDFIIDSNGGVFPLECNPRATSGLHLFNDDVSAVFLDSSSPKVQPSNRKMMLTLAVLLYGWKGRRARTWFQTLLGSKDVIFSRLDLKPFFYQFITYLYFGLVGRSQRVTTMEASTMDIEWNGE